MISIAKCLQTMHSGATFGLRVVAYDKRRRDKCGAVHEYPEAVLVWGSNSEQSSKEKIATSEREPTALERSLMPASCAETITRKPKHADHYTRNIRILAQGHPTEMIVKIHPALIIEFNGEATTP